jgi:hypothetical protein
MQLLIRKAEFCLTSTWRNPHIPTFMHLGRKLTTTSVNSDPLKVTHSIHQILQRQNVRTCRQNTLHDTRGKSKKQWVCD